MDRDTHQDSRSGLEQAARAGDHDARGQLLGDMRDGLVRFCFRYLGNFHAAEDAAQDAQTSAFGAADWPQGSLRPWLFRVARNRCLDLLRLRGDGREGAGSFLGWSMHSSPITGPRTALDRAEDREELRRQVAELRPQHAEVIVLRYFDSLSREEIAQVLELEKSVVKSRLCEARKELRRHMGGDAA